MKYYKHTADYAESEYGEGIVYLEIDEDKDMVVKQVEVCDKAYLIGEWTGDALVGWICDQAASLLGLTDKDAISAEEFASVWKRAKQP
jgi:hypothetical protein